MSKSKVFAQELISFLDCSPTQFHVVQNVSSILEKQGFKSLNLSENWELKEGERYYVTQNGSSLFAFIYNKKSGINMIAAHTDSPGFRIKPDPEIMGNGYIKLNVEMYGGAIVNTWMDRPLGLAGRVILKGEDSFHPLVKNINIERALLTIPNLAIHLNPTINKGYEYNNQSDLQPILHLISENFEKEGLIVQLLSDELGVDKDAILDFELYLTTIEKGCFVGLEQEMISARKIDDCAMVHAGLSALCELENSDNASTAMLCLFDSEEIGSETRSGAGSPILARIIKRIVGNEPHAYDRCVENSFLISADMAHAIHPNQASKHDPVLQPKMNKGVVVKYAANGSYTTDALSAAVIKDIANKAEVKLQYFANRSDMRGGSTLGRVSIAHVDVKSVDLGNPMLAMHSCRELCGVEDHLEIKKLFMAYMGDS
jgi:aspartyl aminopeptidase